MSNILTYLFNIKQTTSVELSWAVRIEGTPEKEFWNKNFDRITVRSSYYSDSGIETIIGGSPKDVYDLSEADAILIVCVAGHEFSIEANLSLSEFKEALKYNIGNELLEHQKIIDRHSEKIFQLKQLDCAILRG